MKYHININKKTVQNLLNNNIEINMILYHIVLKLRLVIQSNIVIAIKDAKNLKLSLMKYIYDMIIWIKDVIIKQSFFILDKNSNACIFNWFFKIIMHMIRQILNDRLIYVTVFDSENNSIQTIFQAYISDDVSDCYEYQMIEINIIQSIKKHLNMMYDI